jgi:hypothetical protein
MGHDDLQHGIIAGQVFANHHLVVAPPGDTDIWSQCIGSKS